MQVEGAEIAKPSTDANPRSFNPNTPANSPSENARLISMGTVVAFHGKSQNCKQIRVRSSSGSNGTKNFMSPTISAASKVTASPRKKILAERNDPVRASSVSFSDLKSPSLNPTVEDPQHMTPKPQKDIDSKELFCSKNEPEEEPVCVNASDESDSVNLDPSFIPPLSCPKSSLVIAPFNADPSAPKTSSLVEDISISGSHEDVSDARPSLYGNLGPTAVVEPECSEAEQSQNVGAADHIDSEPESNVSMREAIVFISLAEEVNTLLSGVHELQHEYEMESFEDHSPISSEVDASSENLQIPSSEDVKTPEEVELTVDETKSQVSTVTLLLSGSTAFIYRNKRKSTASNPANPAISVVQPSLLTKKLDASPSVPFSTEHTSQERPSSWNWIGEPCPSEVSSIQKSSSYHTKGLKASDKAERQ